MLRNNIRLMFNFHISFGIYLFFDLFEKKINKFKFYKCKILK